MKLTFVFCFFCFDLVLTPRERTLTVQTIISIEVPAALEEEEVVEKEEEEEDRGQA